ASRALATGFINIDQAPLLPIRSRNPTKKVIETPVFHHHHDDVLDSGLLWRWECDRGCELYRFLYFGTRRVSELDWDCVVAEWLFVSPANPATPRAPKKIRRFIYQWRLRKVEL